MLPDPTVYDDSWHEIVKDVARRALGHVPGPEAEVLDLYLLTEEDLSLQDIALRLGLTVEEVRDLKSRGLACLRRVSATYRRRTRLIEHACRSHDLESIERLVRSEGHEAVLLDRDPWGWTALDEAVCSGDLPIVRYLLSIGADVQAAPHDFTPLHWAAMLGDVDVCAALIDAGADVNARTERGDTPLDQAHLSGAEATIRLLLAHGAVHRRSRRTTSSKPSSGMPGRRQDVVGLERELLDRRLRILSGRRRFTAFAAFFALAMVLLWAAKGTPSAQFAPVLLGCLAALGFFAIVAQRFQLVRSRREEDRLASEVSSAYATLNAGPERWGLFPWSEELGDEHVHPDDRPSFDAVHPHGHLFEVLGETEGYLRARYEGGEVRVRPELYLPRPVPPFRYGERVEVLPPRTPHVGPVRRITWHFKRGEPLYWLALEGKARKNRYLAEELKSVPPGAVDDR